MAEKIISPGVFTSEIDQSFLPAAIADIGAALIGPTVKGPAGIPTIVTSYSDFQNKFGDVFKSGSNSFQFLTSHAAQQYLRNSNVLTVVRILANGGGSYSGATAEVSSSSQEYSGGTEISFTLTTLGDGSIMNNSDAASTTNNILTTGSKHNVRWETSNVNTTKGTFNLAIRAGNDNTKRKQALETYSNISLDPNSNNYIAKAIGDQYYTVATDENSKPFLKLVGDYPRKSKYVRVSGIANIADYLDENGSVRVTAAETGSLPAGNSNLQTSHSLGYSGSFGGGFSGGSDGHSGFNSLGVQKGDCGTIVNFYENISATNSQGFNPKVAADGQNAYVQALNLLANQDEYDINLILTPGIITAEHGVVASKIIDVCEERQDCFAILDPVLYNKNVVHATTEAETRDSNYAGVYWPWVKIPDNMLGIQRWVPPSVCLGGIYAFNDKVAHPWFAPAGLNRGGIDTAIQAERKLTQADRDTLYDSNVNPIATFPGQGVTVFGQKTLQKKASALDRINVRRLLIKVKKFIASSSRFLVFEQNTAATRQRFLSIVNPFLDTVQSQSGLSAFRVVMDATNNTPDTIDRNYLVGQLFLQPTRTAEFIVLDFTIQPTGASFPE